MPDTRGGVEMAERTCSIEGCAAPAVARTWCNKHWKRWRARGATDDAAPLIALVCSVEGCEKEAVARAWCGTHYKRWQRTGTTDAPPRRDRPRKDRVLANGYAHLYLPEHPCANAFGYVAEHRKVWSDANGPIPEGEHVHHINGVRDDNRLENLECLDPYAHCAQHITEAGVTTNQFGTFPAVMNRGQCRTDGCERDAKRHGRCYPHYEREKRPDRWKRGG